MAIAMPWLVGVGVGFHLTFDHGHRHGHPPGSALEVTTHHTHAHADASTLQDVLHGHAHPDGTPDHDHPAMVNATRTVAGARPQATAAAAPGVLLLSAPPDAFRGSRIVSSAPKPPLPLQSDAPLRI